MKKIVNTAILSLFVMTLTLSCSKEEVLEPSGKTFGYVLPQGDNDYDDRIMEYYKKYNGMMILYDFKPNDAYRTGRLDVEARVDPKDENAYLSPDPGKIGYQYYFFYSPVESEYINQQLDLLEECFFSLYDPEVVGKHLPSKILLTSTIKNPVYTRWPLPAKWSVKDLNTAMVADNIRSSLSVAWGNASILTMTAAQKKEFMKSINEQFILNFLKPNGKIVVPEEFIAITNYKVLENVQEWSIFYSNGVILKSVKTYDADWNSYYDAIINNTEEFLEEYAPNTDGTKKGILCNDKSNGQTPKDSSGKIRKKYNIVLKYYKDNFGIDLRDFQKKKFD